MSEISWNDLTGISGTTDLYPELAISHIQWAFLPDDIIHLVNLRPKAPNVKTTVISMGAPVSDIPDLINENYEGIFVKPWSTYYQISPATKIVEGTGVRPDKTVCATTRLLFADLDVKPGGFESKQEVQSFIDGVSECPGSVVWTGTGGAHVTWRVDPEGASDLRKQFSGRQIGERWWTYLASELERLGISATIDRLIDLDARVLRLPGTIRYPKYEGDVTAEVTAEYYDVPKITYEKFMELTTPTYEPYQKRITKRREDDELLTTEMVSITGREGMWGKAVILSMIDDLSDEHLVWDEILPEAGWTRFREGGDGSTEWTRPGGDGKSATTDWPESPNILSLFSTDPSTGLLDLFEAEIPLTKWRVFLRLIHDDDAYAALDDLGLRVTE